MLTKFGISSLTGCSTSYAKIIFAAQIPAQLNLESARKPEQPFSCSQWLRTFFQSKADELGRLQSRGRKAEYRSVRAANVGRSRQVGRGQVVSHNS
jgi:hypothetical protein